MSPGSFWNLCRDYNVVLSFNKYCDLIVNQNELVLSKGRRTKVALHFVSAVVLVTQLLVVKVILYTSCCIKSLTSQHCPLKESSLLPTTCLNLSWFRLKSWSFSPSIWAIVTVQHHTNSKQLTICYSSSPPFPQFHVIYSSELWW